MNHIPPLVSDLALILITAGIVTILFKWLKQPVVLGYIVAGFLIGPHFFLLPSVADPANVNTWAEIGVIFLLFALGLEFSFKKLMKVGGTAGIATIVNMGSMIVIGYLIGEALGWTQMECLFLGGMLSMSSTTIIIKAFNDMGLQKKRFAGIVFGMLIVEDLAAILMMVLLSTIAVSQHFEGTELLYSGMKLIFFMLIWFVVGIFLIPSLLKKLKRYLNDETLLIVAVGLCLGMVLFANAVGFSAALGAFIMGSILAETIESKHIEHLIEPLKNLFGAVFFVSVGMMIAPGIIAEHAGLILLLTAVVLVGRVIFATLGVLASGQGLKVAMQSGFSLAQIGEFSFIIASLGMGLGVISEFIYPVIVAVSVITTFTTPYFIKLSEPAYRALEKIVPAKWTKLLTGYAATTHKTVTAQNDWRKLLKTVLVGSLIYFVLSIAVVLASRQFFYPLVAENIHNGLWASLISAGATLIVMYPFLAGILRRGRRSPESIKLWNDSHFNRGALIMMNVLKLALCAFLIWLVLVPLFPRATGWIVVASTMIAMVMVFVLAFREKKPGRRSTSRMEDRFFENLNTKDASDDAVAVSEELTEYLLDRNIHIEEFEVSPSSAAVGRTLAEIDIRNAAGVSVICIIRGGRKINIPDGQERVYPYDMIIAAGSDEELGKFNQIVHGSEQESEIMPDEVVYDIAMSHYEVAEDSPLVGRSIKDLNIQRRTECLVLGIESGGKVRNNITPDTVIRPGDTLWLAGEQNLLDQFCENVRAPRGAQQE